MSTETSNGNYLVVTDFVKADTGRDVSDALQELIFKNPRRVLFFPDGEYLLSKPISTPANPEHSVCLHLSNYAIVKASEDYCSDEALIRLGAAEPFNNIYTVGSNYYLSGGIIDGSGKASGVSVDSGRETRIENVSIKNAKIGLRIKYGANSGSADCDVSNVNITGNGALDSIGLLVEGMDNTFTNMRIAGVQTGVKLTGGGNHLSKIHPLYSNMGWDNYSSGVAFYDDSWDNWYDFCYSDQFATGFYMKDGLRSIYHNCFCFWWKTVEGGETGFKADGKFCSIIKNAKVALRDDAEDTNFLIVKENGGCGLIETPCFNEEKAIDKAYREYLVDRVI